MEQNTKRVRVRLPLFNELLIRQDDGAEKSTGGVYLPEAHREKPQQGTILACGEDVEKCLVNDLVLYSKYSGQEFKINDEKLLLLKEQDVLMVIERDEDYIEKLMARMSHKKTIQDAIQGVD